MKSGNSGIVRFLAAILFFPSREEKREGAGSREKRNNYLSSYSFNRILSLKELWLPGLHYTHSRVQKMCMRKSKSSPYQGTPARTITKK